MRKHLYKTILCDNINGITFDDHVKSVILNKSPSIDINEYIDLHSLRTEKNNTELEYQCPRCNYSTSKKSSIRTHFSKKKSCPNRNDVNLTDQIKLLVLQKTTLAGVNHYITNNNNNTTINNITNQTINYYMINPFGQENLDGINFNEELKHITNYKQLMQKMLSLMHCKNQENYNAIVTDRVRQNLQLYQEPPSYSNVGANGYKRVVANILDVLNNNATIESKLREQLLSLFHIRFEPSEYHGLTEPVISYYTKLNDNITEVHKMLNDLLYDHTKNNAEVIKQIKSLIAAEHNSNQST